MTRYEYQDDTVYVGFKFKYGSTRLRVLEQTDILKTIKTYNVLNIETDYLHEHLSESFILNCKRLYGSW